MRNSNPVLNLQHQYLLYLKRIGASEEKFGDIQRIETKRAFYGGFGQALMSFREDLAEDEEEAIHELQTMYDQVREFFEREVKEHGE